MSTLTLGTVPGGEETSAGTEWWAGGSEAARAVARGPPGEDFRVRAAGSRHLVGGAGTQVCGARVHPPVLARGLGAPRRPVRSVVCGPRISAHGA